ncbi:MAG: SRPBCC family protein [Pseudomonadota bacterium]
MRWILRIGGGLLVLVLALAAGSFLISSDVRVERSIVIEAEPEAVFAHLDSLQAFHAWSPWAARDPEMVTEFSGPDTGVGNRMAWSSDDPQLGSGTQEIVDITPGERVETSVEFDGMGSTAIWSVAGAGTGTEVSWIFQTDMGMNPIGRYLGLMMDRWIGPDYEEGLANLKSLVEAES